MNYVSSPSGWKCGLYVTFYLHREPLFHVISRESKYWATLHIGLPCDKRSEWIAGVAQILRRNDCGWPVKMQTENARTFFSIEDLERLEALFPATQFYLHAASKKLAAEQRRDIRNTYGEGRKRSVFRKSDLNPSAQSTL